MERIEIQSEELPIEIDVIREESDLVHGITAEILAEFLSETMKPYNDNLEDSLKGVKDALNGKPGKGGFILLATQDRKPIGSLVMLATGMSGYIPEYILLFVAVSPKMRGMGIGSKFINLAKKHTDGKIKLHVEYDNPAKRLYEKHGFISKYAEMRFE